MAKLRIEGPWPAWSDRVKSASLVGEADRSARVFIRELDLEAEPENLESLQEEARCLADIRHPGMLRLLHVSSLEGKATHVYKFFEGVSLQTLLAQQRARRSFLPVKICGELVAAVATALSQTANRLSESYPGRLIMHRGPSPEDVLVNASGRVKVAAMAIRRPGEPTTLIPLMGYTPPEGNESDASLAYAIGALTCELFTGRRLPAGSTDEARHDAMVRAAIITLRDRPGEEVGEFLIEIVLQCLARIPGTRPSLGELAQGLQEAATGLRGPGVRAWAGAAVPTAIRRSEEQPKATPSHEPPAIQAVPVPAPMTDEVPTVVTADPDAEALRRAALSNRLEPTAEQPRTDLADITIEAAMPLKHAAAPSMDHEPTVVIKRESLPQAMQAPGLDGVEGPLIDASRPPEELDTAPPPEPPSGGASKVAAVLGLLIMFVLAGAAVVLALKPELIPLDVYSTPGAPPPIDEEVPADRPAEPPPQAPPEPAPPQKAPLQIESDAPPQPAAITPTPSTEPDAPEEPASPAADPDENPEASPELDPEAENGELNVRLGAQPEAGPTKDEEPAEKAEEPAGEAEEPAEEAEEAEEPAGDTFTAIFASADPAITGLTVRCHRGTSTGIGPVTVSQAEPGPCRIQAQGPDGSLVAFFTLNGPGTYTCFSEGSRDCQ